MTQDRRQGWGTQISSLPPFVQKRDEGWGTPDSFLAKIELVDARGEEAGFGVGQLVAYQAQAVDAAIEPV